MDHLWAGTESRDLWAVGRAGHCSWTQQGLHLVLPLYSCVTLDRSPNLSVPGLACCLHMEGVKSTSWVECVKSILCSVSFRQRVVGGRHSISPLFLSISHSHFYTLELVYTRWLFFFGVKMLTVTVLRHTDGAWSLAGGEQQSLPRTPWKLMG